MVVKFSRFARSAVPVWQGAIVAPELPSQSQLERWLTKLDVFPEPLHQALRDAPTKRLGLYAEVLLAFFLLIQVSCLRMVCK
jgi:hypothetical protein